MLAGKEKQYGNFGQVIAMIQKKYGGPPGDVSAAPPATGAATGSLLQGAGTLGTARPSAPAAGLFGSAASAAGPSLQAQAPAAPFAAPGVSGVAGAGGFGAQLASASMAPSAAFTPQAAPRFGSISQPGAAAGNSAFG